ncbi:MAG: hypothetical protein KDK78_12355 [Chlamydiia bacterium]|nr:hypothetical protein [Chlamydiia bacterium]
MMVLAALDGGGAHGLIFQQAFTFLLMFSALLAFVYCWKTGNLDWSEGAKMHMFEPDHDGCQGEENERR